MAERRIGNGAKRPQKAPETAVRTAPRENEIKTRSNSANILARAWRVALLGAPRRIPRKGALYHFLFVS